MSHHQTMARQRAEIKRLTDEGISKDKTIEQLRKNNLRDRKTFATTIDILDQLRVATSLTLPSAINIPIIAIAACDDELAIGKDDTIPWKLKGDMLHFKKQTMGYPIIMGRKTWDSFDGYRLPGRTHIVISRQKDLKLDGAIVVSSIEDAIGVATATARTNYIPKIFVIGGGEIYKQFVPYITQVILTRVHASIDNVDAWFPSELVRPVNWFINVGPVNKADDKNEYDYSIHTYTKRSEKFL